MLGIAPGEEGQATSLDNRFDGDMMNCNISYSDEAKAEVANYFKQRRAYVGTDGRFTSSTDVATTALVLFNLTGDQPNAS